MHRNQSLLLFRLIIPWYAKKWYAASLPSPAAHQIGTSDRDMPYERNSLAREGYKPAKMSANLISFIEEYADAEPNTPGCPEECVEICERQGLCDILDLKALAKRVWLGDYFPAKVAIRFENALESSEMSQVRHQARIIRIEHALNLA